jgi:hypothetical protein
MSNSQKGSLGGMAGLENNRQSGIIGHVIGSNDQRNSSSFLINSRGGSYPDYPMNNLNMSGVAHGQMPKSFGSGMGAFGINQTRMSLNSGGQGSGLF